MSDGVHLTFVVDSSLDGKRLDRGVTEFLAAASEAVEDEESPLYGGTSRTKVAAWIAEDRVIVDGRVAAKPALVLKAGMTIGLSIPPPPPSELHPDSTVRLAVVYEDDDVLIVNKPAGLVVHPGSGNERATLVHGLLAHIGPQLARVGSPLRPGIVHRLDKDTTGLLAVAKTIRAYESFVQQFLQRSVSRLYVALTLRLPQGSETITLPLGRDPRERTKMAVVQRGGKHATTVWELREALASGYLLQLSLRTGRTHQIRVHLLASKAGIVGDLVYRVAESEIPAKLRPLVASFGRQALHAEQLQFLHPVSGQTMQFAAPLPPDFLELIKAFRQ